MVDSNDRDRIGEARDELHRMLNEVRIVATLMGQTMYAVATLLNLNNRNSASCQYGDVHHDGQADGGHGSI